MNEQIKIAAFKQYLELETEEDRIVKALNLLAEIDDPQAILHAKGGGPQPLGSWGGWGK